MVIIMELNNKYSKIGKLCKILAPVSGALFYVFFVLMALLVIIAAIVAVVRVAPEDMLLPPFMKSAVDENGVDIYNIFLGNGVKITLEKAAVTLNDIKAVIYSFIVISISSLLLFTPICRFMSRLLKNTAAGEPFLYENAKMVNYIGLTVIIGNTALLFVRRFYNYILIKTFIGGDEITFAPGIDWNGIIVGLFILLLGYIYGYACGFAEQSKTADNISLSVREYDQEDD